MSLYTVREGRVNQSPSVSTVCTLPSVNSIVRAASSAASSGCRGPSAHSLVLWKNQPLPTVASMRFSPGFTSGVTS